VNPFEKLDAAADRLVASFPLFNVTHEQTHRHHVLISALAGGFLGMAAFGLFTGPGLWLFTRPLAIGVLGGVLAYLVREIIARLLLGWKYARWDGVLDVLVPFRDNAPWALAALATGVPWWTGLVFFLSTALVGLSYTVWRPRGKLLLEHHASQFRSAAAMLRDAGDHWRDKRGDLFAASDHYRAADYLDGLAGPWPEVPRGTPSSSHVRDWWGRALPRTSEPRG
jgi:hypothetical protein